MSIKKPATDPVVAADIVDTSIAQQLQQALDVGKSFVDSPDTRAALGQAAQDRLIALRLLGCPYNAHAICLYERSASGKDGDLYVFGQPCHPRDAGERIAAGSTVPDLIDLVTALKASVDYEAAPAPVVAAAVAPSSSSSSSSPASSPAPVAAAASVAAPAPAVDLSALASLIVAQLKAAAPAPAPTNPA